jgi:hypothetical protein
MSLPRDGIQFVAQDADKFIGALQDVGTTYDEVTGRFRDASGKFVKANDAIASSGSAVAQQADSFMGAIGGISQGFSLLDGVVLGAGQKLVDFALNVPGLVIDGLLGIADAVIDVGSAIGELATEAAQLQGVAAGFGNFAAQTEAGAEAILFSLEAASAGMISTGDLMTKFNDAAALVSVQFAERLPEGLEILGKVSAATGTDLNFLLDSFVTGIGRVSPAIIDNLKVQVSLAEATAAGAEMFGKSAEQLTKTEQQMALTEVTLGKLTEKFGDLPDVTQSATANLARIDAMFSNIRAQIGSAFLPAWTTMTNAVANAVGFFSDAIREGGILFPVLSNLGAAASIAADGFEQAVFSIINFVDDTQTAINTGLAETTDNALNWGVNIATSFAQGLIDGAASALTVAMNFISGMLSGWLAPGSPPRVAPDLPEWGLNAMAMFLDGFTQADFGILEGIQAPLSKVLGDIEFAEVSQEIARAISAGEVDEGLFDTIAASAGEFGTEIADLARLQFELVTATDALTAAEMAQADATNEVADAQDRLNESTEAVEDSQAEVARLTEEYNELLRDGADPSILNAQLDLINAAEMQRDAAIEQNRTAAASLETAEMVKETRDEEAEAAQTAAQAEVDAAEERLKNQQDLVNQLISLSEKARTEAVTEDPEAVTPLAGAVAAAGIVTPEAIMPDIGIAEAFDFTGGLEESIEKAKATMLEKFGGIFDPVKEIIEAKFGPESAIGQKWGEITEKLKKVWDDELVPFWEDTLEPAIETVQTAFSNMQTFWETSTIPELAGEAFGIFLRTVTDLADRIIPFFADQLKKISEWYLENKEPIDTIMTALVNSWDLVSSTFVVVWDTIEPILGFMVDEILNLGTIVLSLVTGDWQTAWDTAEQIVDDLWQALTESFTNFIAGIQGILEGDVWQGFIDVWQGNWDNALLIVTTIGEDLLTAVSGIIDSISTWLGEQWEVFKGWGRDIIRGLSEGITDKVESVILSISKAVGAAVDAAKEALGISSPSAVFAEFGENTVEGFVGGILGAESMIGDAVGSMFGANAMQLAVQPSFTGAQFAQDAQPMMREVSIQIGPNFIQGMNDREFVQRVRQVLRNELRRN